MEHQRPLESVPDDELLRRLAELLQQSRGVESDLVAHIAEVDERRLYAREASFSMFAYCTEVLHLSEAEAYLRIEAARASRKHPMFLTMLGDGRLHLTGIAKLAPHLTRENRDALLERATHRSKRQIEELIAEIAPRPDAPAVMRKLPERKPLEAPALWVGPGEVPPPGELRPDGVGSLSAAPSAVIQPLAPTRYRVQFTASAELYDKLERLRALMRSQVPDGDLGAILERPLPRSSNGSKPGASRRRALRGRVFLRPTPLPPRATSRPRSGVRCTSVTEANAAMWMRRADDVPSATGSNTTTGTPTAWEATTVWATSA